MNAHSGRIRVLLIEDSLADARLIQEVLFREAPSGFEVEHSACLAAGLARLERGDVDVVLLDLTLPDSEGLATLSATATVAGPVPILVLTGLEDEELARRAMSAGAQDYLPKGGVDGHALARALRHAIERKRTAERLRFQADILGAVRDSVVVTDLDGQVTYWNEGAVEIWGYTAAEAVTKSAAFLYPDASTAASELKHELDEIFAGRNRCGEWQGRHKNGTRVWVDFVTTALRSETGEVTGIVIVAKDITERRRAAEAQARLTAILEAATDFIGMATPDGRCLYMNRAGRRMVGVGAEEELTTIAQYSPEWAVRKFVEEGFPVAARDGVWEGEEAFLDPHGREIPVWQVIVAHQGENGAVEHFSTIARDMTERNRYEEELRRLNETLRALVEASPLAIVTVDAASRVTLWSPAAESTFGWRAGEVLGQRLPIVPDDKWDEHFALGQRVLAGERFVGIEIRRRDKTGAPIDLRISAAPLRDADGSVQGMALFLEDINDRKRAERAIRRLASMPEQSPDPVVELDLAGNALYVNQAARSRFPDLQALGSWHPVLGNVASILPRFRHGEKKSFSFEITHDQSAYHQMVYYVPDSALVRVFLHDVTEQHRAKELIEREALHDRLTDLPNRTLFLRRVDEQLKSAREQGGEHFVLLSLNLDRFKVVNDSLGQAAGDQLLRSVARRIAACLGAGDMVARLSGDEFAVLLRETRGLGESLKLAESLREAICLPVEISRQEIFPSVSIGIALGESYEDGESLLRDAHIAMYRAKALGGGRYEVFDRAMANRSLDRLRLENELRRAIERNELKVHYQPIVRLSDGAVVAFEALLRWPRAERGMVPPSEFIPVAEEAGLIQSLSYWVLGQVCQRLREWKTVVGATRLAMHVNLSGRLFADPGLVDRVRTALAEARIEGDRLVLEITESVLMGDLDTATETLNRLKALGVGIAIDDFGTGYSSLSYLQRFPIDSLKIDRSFVAKMGERGESPEILRAILTLARSLSIEVIAEGVESEAQLGHLLALGCDQAQGFLFSRPVDREAARSLLAEPSSWAALFPAKRPTPVVQEHDNVTPLRRTAAS
ncbi:MAG TPA: EAL domain-containing protein [Thermoanaerobaculia bacterium]|jgi:diguanylate cyclase (GGDEF)-like protein/PAS domain S-box-containing protein|nr:EAL domain-containing protein [Thermoanaerobaculia bacterium]